MTKITNYARGPRGITLKDGSTVWLEPGQSGDIDKDDIAGPLPDLGDPNQAIDTATDDKARVAELEAENAELRAKLAAFDPDGDGKAGGSAPKSPPALSGKSKADLLAIAADEGVEIEDGATNDDIKATIELAREAAE